MVGDGVGNSLYNTARFGDFSYKFSSLEPEIVFTTSPPGSRVFYVFIQSEKVVSSLDIYGQSKLWLVDLPGSERVAKTEVHGERLKETQNINRSLSALGDVISALATKSPHIPFRNSKLTHLLQDSLGGDSKTLMFVEISPQENDLGETPCSLNFASGVTGIELGPVKKQMDCSKLLRCKQMVQPATYWQHFLSLIYQFDVTNDNSLLVLKGGEIKVLVESDSNFYFFV
ncbi:hypothetical protein SCA6_018047 [Theobroma cacao]